MSYIYNFYIGVEKKYLLVLNELKETIKKYYKYAIISDLYFEDLVFIFFSVEINELDFIGFSEEVDLIFEKNIIFKRTDKIDPNYREIINQIVYEEGMIG